MSQDIVSKICCMFIDKHYSRWYSDIFKLFNKMNLNKMSETFAKELLGHIIGILRDEKEREQINRSPMFLCTFRKQNRDLTEEMDKSISKYLPNFYKGDYKLETTENEQSDLPSLIQKYIDIVRKNNETQGKSRDFFGLRVRNIAIIRSIITSRGFKCPPDIMNSVISVTADTLLISKESLSTKLDAVSLLISIVLNFDNDYKRNITIFEKLVEKREEIESAESATMFSNLNKISLKIGLQLLYTAMGKDTYADLLELLPYLRNDIPTTTSVISMIAKYLETMIWLSSLKILKSFFCKTFYSGLI